MALARECLMARFGSFSDLIHMHALERPSRRALVQGDDVLDYLALDGRMDRIGVRLQQVANGASGTVAIVSTSTIAAATVFLGAIRGGLVPVPMAPSSTPEQLTGMIDDAEAVAVFADHNSAEQLPRELDVILLEDLDAWLGSSDTLLHRREPKPDDPFNIIYSSGTTGTPKGIVHSHQMRWNQILPYEPFGYAEATTLVATPLYSNTTLVSFLPTLAFGGTVVLLEKFDVRTFLEVAERERVTHAMLVPVQYKRIMEFPAFDRFDLSSFQLKTCTSAPFAADLKADVVRRWPGLLLEFYGMTEGGGACMLNASANPHKLHSVGQPLPGHDIRVIDAAGCELPIGEVGEVVGRSPAMMSGYHRRKEATESAIWTDTDGNKFVRHGDLGRFDAEGFLTLVGRAKDMIISGGFNIYPADLEDVLIGHPDVSEAAVIGVPDERWGETPLGFYVAANSEANEADILAWVNARVGKTQKISRLQQIDELPRNEIGKVAKLVLRDLL